MPKKVKKKGKGKSKAEDAAKLAQLEAERKSLLQTLKSNYSAKARSFLREPLPCILNVIDQAISRGEPVNKLLLAKLRLTVGDLWAFASTFKSFSELTSLSLCLVELDDKMLGILAQFIRTHPPLVTLSIVGCSSGPSMGHLLADSIAHSRIITLNLDFNTIGQGWPALFKSIGQSKIEKLSGVSTSLDEIHASSLTLLLQSDPPLKDLDLSCNHLGFNAFLDICQVLEVNTHLEILNLSSNNIRMKSGAKFTTFINPTCRLQSLDLRHNQIENNGGEVVLELLKTRKTLLLENRISTPLCIFVTERISSTIFSKINEINKWMEALSKKKKKTASKSGKKKK